MVLRVLFWACLIFCWHFILWDDLTAHKTDTHFAELKDGWNKIHPISEKELEELRNESWHMFDRSYKAYMSYGFPMDDVKPITCKGSNSQGGIALTLLDVLDTLILMNRTEDFRNALKLTELQVDFDKDETVSVFEVNIRALGGLLSAHLLLERNPEIVPNYEGLFLKKAVDLADRLLPAFETPSGIPFSNVNLRKGKVYGDSNLTCTACAGTLLLEFGMLSRLTGLPDYEARARRAIRVLFDARSQSGLLGNTINAISKVWARRDSGIGAGIDSMYEYLLKAYLLFGDEEYLDMFVEVYSAIIYHAEIPKLLSGFQWLGDVHMHEGFLMGPWVSSLGAFWPGMQALAGLEEAARNLHRNFTAIWVKFGGLPEQFSIDGTRSHPIGKGYPLRPELIESTFFLHALTKDPYFLEVGRCLHAAVASTNTFKCGHASVRDVNTGQMEDKMESFFMSETAKYLYLLASNTTEIADFFVMTTEAHLLPPVKSVEAEEKLEPDDGEIPEKCMGLCTELTLQEMEKARSAVHSNFPLLVTKLSDIATLRHRRCIACIRITERLDHLPKKNMRKHAQTLNMEWAVGGEDEAAGQCSVSSPEPIVLQDAVELETVGQLQCLFHFGKDGKLECSNLVPLQPTKKAADLEKLEPNSVVFSMLRVRDSTVPGRVVIVDAQNTLMEFESVFAAFGKQLDDIGDCKIQVVHSSEPDAGSDDDYLDDLENAEELRMCDAHHQSGSDDGSDDDDDQCSGRFVRGPLAFTQPFNACHDVLNPENVKGKIAAVVRGTCPFTVKVWNAQRAGAIGVIVMNNVGKSEIISMRGDERSSGISIPAAMISKASGNILSEKLKSEQHLTAVLTKSASDILDATTTSNTCPVNLNPLMPIMALDDDGIGNVRAARIELILPVKTQQYLAEQMNAGQNPQKVLPFLLQNLMTDKKALKMMREMEFGHRQRTP